MSRLLAKTVSSGRAKKNTCRGHIYGQLGNIDTSDPFKIAPLFQPLLQRHHTPTPTPTPLPFAPMKERHHTTSTSMQYEGEEHVTYGDGGLEEEEGGYAVEEGPAAAAAATPGKRRKKRAYKKAPDAPRRGRSAYVLFSMEARESVKNGLPEGSK